jgi:ornithine cyclodeaminase/alanine dehydrogenase-like protein (mu-crystallin family)
MGLANPRGRGNDQEITVFDSTGLAIHDIICAKLAYNKAKEESIERTVPLMC